MQKGSEEIGEIGLLGLRGRSGRHLGIEPDGVAFPEETRRAEGGTQEESTFTGGRGKSASVLEQTHGRAGAGKTAPEKVREINGHRYTYVQPDAADYTAPVRTAANYAKQRYGLDIDVSDDPTYVDGREHNDLMFTK